MSELKDHLRRVQDISSRVREFGAGEASDSKAFSQMIVEDLGALADAVGELIVRAGD